MTFDLPTVLSNLVESAARLRKADKAQIVSPSENVHRLYSAASYGHTTFADQAAIAIENVRLFDAEQQRTRELAKNRRRICKPRSDTEACLTWSTDRSERARDKKPA